MNNNNNNVDHPAYYNSGKIEVIDYIKDQGWSKGFCLGNAIKYISRAGRKNANTEIEDLEKAIWYIKSYLSELYDLDENS